ncbi:triacylglycerol lipase 2-like [Punica granatum]|uniref:Lipase n=1 Tax=Punica granatum TaxID=22663 RepID=A0A6P8DBS5_PUNGR|nr:triacylglycerol lipase 2-like [Punica granatum]
MRPKLPSDKGQDESDDGICKSMVEPQNYVCEEHTVTTGDGYILSLQRIPVGRSGGTSVDRPPVLLQHGLMMDGSTWMLLPPEKSLAFLLVDNGFDVWIANSRGTKYSRGHVSLSPDDAAFWDWSWDELASSDLPAAFGYVQDQTRQKLHYVGHSQGTLTALAAFLKEQLLSMLRSAALLSPIAYLGQMTSLLARNVAEGFIAETLYWLGLNEFNPTGDAVANMLKDICQKTGIDCSDLLTSFTGQNCCTNSSVVELLLDRKLQSSSMKNMVHLSQMVRDGTVSMYDYEDEAENIQQYGQPTPPSYNMTSIPNDIPLFLSYGGADALSDVDDVKLLLRSLRDHDGDKLVIQYLDNYAHADFVMADNAREIVYNPLIAFLQLQ